MLVENEYTFVPSAASEGLQKNHSQIIFQFDTVYVTEKMSSKKVACSSI